MNTPEAEITAVAQAAAAFDAAMDIEDVQESWPEWDQAKYREKAWEFITLHNALMAHREKSKAKEPASFELYRVYATASFNDRPAARKAWEDAVKLEEQQEEDLDLVERTPHAFRGEKWLAAAKRLDAAGISYTPGARYNQKAGK